jgi:hypothetical protein
VTAQALPGPAHLRKADTDAGSAGCRSRRGPAHATSQTPRHPAGTGPVESGPTAQAGPVGWGFVARYALAYAGATLLLLAPLLVSLALKVNSLVGIDRAPGALALVTGTGSLLAMVANPFFGRLSDRTSSRLGMRRPWMLAGLAGGCLRPVACLSSPTC